METTELIKLVDTTIGSYKAYGSHGSDMEAYKNLNNVSELIMHLINNLCDNAKDINHYAYSIAAVGKRSKQILNEIQEMINEVNHKIEEDNKLTAEFCYSDSGSEFDIEYNKKYLEKNKRYKVDRIDMSAFSTRIYLEGFEDSKNGFNSVCFTFRENGEEINIYEDKRFNPYL